MGPEILNRRYLENAYRLYNLFDAKKEAMRKQMDVLEKLRHRWNLKESKKYIKKIDSAIISAQNSLSRIAVQASKKGIDIPLETLFKKYGLDSEQRFIILTLYFKELEKGRYEMTGRELLTYLGYQPIQFGEKSALLADLLEKELIKCGPRSSADVYLLQVEFALSFHILKHITGKELTAEDEEYEMPWEFTKTNSKEPVDKRTKKKGFFNIYEPVLTFDQIVLESDKIREIERAIYQAKNLNNIFEAWGLNETIKYGKGTIMLFYGPPGTGKTVTSEAIAHELEKKIGIVNYENVLGCWVGESEKNLVSVFEDAKKEKCVLVFDEADTLFAKRFYETYSTDRMHNYMTNILMRELERFDGVVIMTTNREVVMDEAFDRRIILKLKFDIPGPEERIKIWRKLISEKTPLAEDINFERLGRMYELTGGEIKNAILNAVTECAYCNERFLTMATLERFAQKEARKLTKMNNKSLGFNPGPSLS